MQAEPAPFVVHAPVLLSPNALNPVAFNPRKISPEKYEALKANIIAEGFVEAIVVQKSGLRIIGGHQRVRAVREICIEAGAPIPDIPCIVLDIDDERAKKLNIKLNGLKGEFEARMLGELLVDIFPDLKISPDEAMDLGFTQEESLKYMRLVEPEIPQLPSEETEPRSFGRSITLSLEFKTVEDRDRIKKLLHQQAELEKKKTGDVVAALLAPKAIRKRSEVRKKGKRGKKSNGHLSLV